MWDRLEGREGGEDGSTHTWYKINYGTAEKTFQEENERGNITREPMFAYG